MQYARNCYFLQLLMFAKVVGVNYNVNYVTFSTIPFKSIIFRLIVSVDKISNKLFSL